jgi:hypothetical protein
MSGIFIESVLHLSVKFCPQNVLKFYLVSLITQRLMLIHPEKANIILRSNVTFKFRLTLKIGKLVRFLGH